MSQKREVKVGDAVNTWDLLLPEYAGCEFKVFERIPRVEITKVPDPKPEIPDEPMTRGSVVTIEGDDEFIAVRFRGADDMSYPFVAAYSVAGSNDLFGWREIVSRAKGRKIIVHKMVDPNEVPAKVDTYDEWASIPVEGRKKYKWKDTGGDLWFFSDQRGGFVIYGRDDSIYTIYDDEFFPLIRDEKIG